MASKFNGDYTHYTDNNSLVVNKEGGMSNVYILYIYYYFNSLQLTDTEIYRVKVVGRVACVIDQLYIYFYRQYNYNKPNMRVFFSRTIM